MPHRYAQVRTNIANMAISTREVWLHAALARMRAVVETHGASVPPIRVSVGWPSRLALSRRKRRVGECWPRETAGEDHAHVFVSPALAEPVEVLATLLHELCHAALPKGAGHKASFKRLAVACGLTGKMTATLAGPELAADLAAVAAELGPFDHHKLDGRRDAKQSTRLRLWECQCEPPVKVRVGHDEFDATCNRCGAEFARKGDDA